MAQPEHVRNDPHVMIDFSSDDGFLVPSSVIEKITDLTYGSTPGNLPDPISPETFSKARYYWADPTGNGLAQFTNRNFVSPDTNFRGSLEYVTTNPDYDLPNLEETEISIETWQTLAAEGSTPLINSSNFVEGGIPPNDGKIYFIGTKIRGDAVHSFNPRTSSLSIYDEDLRPIINQNPCFPSNPESCYRADFRLNYFTVVASHPMLLPRAVGYSAGLINYFFRGKIDFACDGSGQMPCVIKNEGAEDLFGVFELWSENPAGQRSLVKRWGSNHCDENGCTVVSGIGVRADEAARVEGFGAPDNAASYVLVFRGKMGFESDSVVAKVIPNSFLAMTTTTTFAYHPIGVPENTPWQRLSIGPLSLSVDATEDRGSAEGFAVSDRLLFASFGNSVNDASDTVPVWRSLDGGRSFEDISADLSGDWTLNAVVSLGGSELLAAFNGYPLHGAGDNPLMGGFAYSDDLGAHWQVRGTPLLADHEPVVIPIGDGVVLAQGLKTGDGSGLLRSTDKGVSWAEVKPTMDGEQWKCVENGIEGFFCEYSHAAICPPMECSDAYQAWQDGIYTNKHTYVWFQVCFDGGLDFCNCEYYGSNNIIINDCNGYDAWLQVPLSQSCGCAADESIGAYCCSGYLLSPYVDTGALEETYNQCWRAAVCADVTPAPACFGQWRTSAMAWNGVTGAGGVLLAGGEATRIDSIGGQFQQAGIWKSTDGGDSWRLVYDTSGRCDPANPRNLTRQPFSIISVSIAPSGESLAVAEGVDGEGERKRKLYRSTDAGESWNETGTPEGNDGTIGVMYLGSSLPPS